MTIPTISERMELHGESYAARFERKTIERIARLMNYVELKSNPSVADFGCGNAMLLDCIHEKAARYVGVDFSETFIEVAKERAARLNCQDVEFYCGSIEEFCISHPGMFDACFALDLSEHVPDEEWAKIVESMFVCLKPGGKAYSHTPNLEFFVERMKATNFVLNQFPEHVAVRSPTENVNFFQKAGFKSVKLHFLPHYNILRFIHPLSRFPGIGHYFRARLFISACKPGDVR